MAINPSIPLQTRAIDPSQGIGQLANAIQFKQQMDFRKEQAGKQNKLQQDRIDIAREQLKQSGQMGMFREHAFDLLQVQPLLSSGNVEGAALMAEQRLQRLKERGLDTSNTEQFIQTLRSDPNAALQSVNSQITAYGQLGVIAGPGSEKNSFADETELVGDDLVVGLDDNGNTFVKIVSENKTVRGEEARKLITEARAKEAERADRDAQRSIDTARRKKLESAAVDASQEAFEQLPAIRQNIANLEDVVRLVEEEGAETGPLAQMLPSFRTAAIELDNLQSRLGLDVIATGKFGPLSEGELKLALETALPQGLEGPALVDWAKRKIAAQEKLHDYLREKAIFLQQGKTQADWELHVEARSKAGNPVGGGKTSAIDDEIEKLEREIRELEGG